MTVIQIVLMLAALYNTALVVLVLKNTRTHRTGRGFVWYLLAITSWILCAALIQSAYSDRWNLHFVHLCFASAILIEIAWFWFCAAFPKPSKQFKKIAWVLTGASIPWFFIALTPLIVPALQHTHGELNVVIGPLFLGYFLWLFLSMPVSFLYLLKLSRHVNNVERLQIRYILFGTVVMLIIGSIPTLFLPFCTGSSRFAPFAPLSSLFVTTAVTYAVIRARLMDIRVVLKTVIAYSLTLVLLCLLYTVLEPILCLLFSLFLSFSDRISSFVVGFTMALAFHPLLICVKKALEARFFPAVGPDPQVMLREACTLLSKEQNRERIVQDFAETLNGMYSPCGVSIYIAGHRETLTQVSLSSELAESPRTLSSTDPLFIHAQGTDDVLLAEELIRQQAPIHQLGAHLNNWGAVVAVPLLAGPQVCGLVLLGEKLSGDVYTGDDLGLLRILGKQAAIALIHAQHFDEMVLLNEYHERLLNTIQDGVLAIDPQGHILTCNPASAAILGVAAEEALGGTLATIGLGQLPYPSSGATTLETTLMARHGLEIPAHITITPFWRQREVAPCYLLVVRDLSALRALEREKLQAERFSSMGAMAATLAHEIKNPLAPIQAFAHLLQTQYDDAQFRADFSHTVVQEVERITRLVGQLLDLVRKPATDRAPVDLARVVDQLLAIIGPECTRAGIRLHRAIMPSLPELAGNAGQLHQALLNILTNAVQAMPDGGDLWITLGLESEHLCCRVQDSGPGVAAEMVGRIFEPLYTTKPGGRGLGLALTYQFVKAHGGEVHAELPPEGGLAITLLLPPRVHAPEPLTYQFT